MSLTFEDCVKSAKTYIEKAMVKANQKGLEKPKLCRVLYSLHYAKEELEKAKSEVLTPKEN